VPVVGVPIMDFPNSWGAHPDDAFEVAEQCIKEFEGCNTIKYAVCPHAPYTVSDASLVKCRDFQRGHGLLMHSHMHETLDEVENSSKGIGAKGQAGRHLSDECSRPFANYQRLGLLSDSFIGAHCVHCDAADIELMQVQGYLVCPKMICYSHVFAGCERQRRVVPRLQLQVSVRHRAAEGDDGRRCQRRHWYRR
jgi:5-methylthioadenosine/S-adenosylhomocysteine deaminase